MDRLKSEENLGGECNVDNNGEDKSRSQTLEDEGSEDLQPFMGMKIPRRASIYRECTNGDYVGVESDPYLAKILSKQGDRTVLFADKVLKFSGSGKMKRRILLITDFAIYLIDPDTDALKRRIALAAVDRKKEIVSVLVEATKSTTEELEVVCSNRFEYNAAADMVKEVQFEEVDGGIKTRIRKKENQS